jgi:plastocyanin
LSSPLAQNQTYSFAYDKTGTFSYHCSIHPSMKGTVIVTN